MPILNGKYKNPGWKNNQPPALNNTELNAISDTLERLDQSPGGGGGKRVFRFVIGTSAAGWTAADCDYLCDGTADNVEIQAAINDLPEEGGTIWFLDGTYQLAAELTALNRQTEIGMAGGSRDTVKLVSMASTFFDWIPSLTSSCFSAEGITFESASDSAFYLQNNTVHISQCGFHNVKLSPSSRFVSNETVSFSFSKNLFREDNSQAILELMVPITNPQTNTASISVIDNIFYGKDGASDLFSTTIQNCSVNFVGNTIIGNGITAPYLGEASFFGNTIYGCKVSLGEGSAVGNHIINGALIMGLYSTGTISGNDVEDGYIAAHWAVSVVGNTIHNPPVAGGIQIASAGINSRDYFSPTVSGNTIARNTPISGIGIALSNNPNSSKTVYGALITGNKIINFQTPVSIQSQWGKCMVTANLFNTGAIQNSGTDNIVRDNSDGSGN